ncbi:DUF1573 domain-containing protein [Mongoliitalea daihaiensis]|uniref:DUF1573 domain-containing protein n=1 Tax=Mongoliitalea daihaiensis TaxID=2782006 RepID=UPI001F2F3D91|nr:DUF1573 domain-containing protein [Mongoliitalea daihaiensis]UJP63892.1 DUF1573 domain-containing protein [Mongoliitalea daihaiensis]
MKISIKTLIIALITFFLVNPVDAQEIERKLLDWQNKSLYIGPVVAENGSSTVEFFGKNPYADSLVITDVITDCGCTVVEYSKDTLVQDDMFRLTVSYNSDYRGGEFKKYVLVRSNLDIYGDTLVIEGINFPVVDDPVKNFPYRVGPLGFRLPMINMGQVFTNEPKLKFYDVYNFSNEAVSLADLAVQNWPQHIQITFEPALIEAGQRALVSLMFDAENAGAFGYYRENLQVQLNDGESYELGLTGSILEYFEPVPQSMASVIPRLHISNTEVDFKEISSSKLVQKVFDFSNLGQEPLLIRQVSSSCECVQIDLPKNELFPGEKIEVLITFDPKGRKGIDHKHVTVFTNDPINPVRTITLRSMIK